MKNDFLNEFRIASPCSVGWESMTGTDRVRLCHQCKLHVYDISALTQIEAAALIAKTEGRLCVRMHRRSDGTVLTRYCPIGLRALRRRVTRRAGAALTAILSLSVGLLAQTRPPAKKADKNARFLKVEKQLTTDQSILITGLVIDSNGAYIPGASVKLVSKANKVKLKTQTDDNGTFRFAGIKAGEYKIEIVHSGFVRLKQAKLMLQAGESLRLEANLQVKDTGVRVGMIQRVPVHDNGTLTLSEEQIRSLPH